MSEFTNKHETAFEWLKDHPDDTPYRRRIIQLHYRYPWASLAQLRGHPRKAEIPVSMFPVRSSFSKLDRLEWVEWMRDFANRSGILEYDAAGNVIPWRRPEDEPE